MCIRDRYGDPLGLSVFLAEFRTQSFDARSLAAWHDALLLLHESFWARFGWMNVPVPAGVIWFYGIIELVGLLGLIMLIHRITMDKKQGSMSGSGCAPIIILFAFPLLSFAWVVSFALSSGPVSYTHLDVYKRQHMELTDTNKPCGLSIFS